MGSISAGEWDAYNLEFKQLKGALADVDVEVAGEVDTHRCTLTGKRALMMG